MDNNHPMAQESPPNLLIVDDSPINLKLLCGMLKQHGYKVRPAPSGILALQAARQSPPDLILLDITMPDMNGYEVCEQLKADVVLKAIPVIFVSALDGTFDKVKAFAVGGVDFITKPFQIEEVEARVRTHLLLRRQERQLQDNLLRLQELERLRDNLVHMIVHDLRSPIAAIQLFMELLQQDVSFLPLFIRELIPVTNSATATLNGMVTQLLDISRLEAGQMPINKELHDLAQHLRFLVESVVPLADARHVTLGDVAPCYIMYDRDVIGRVVTNLLTNAIKFTPPGGQVKLTVEKQPDWLRVNVSDNGCGIAPEHHRKIFDKFGQAELKNKRIGFGLGLAFCKLAVEAHGGLIGVTSALGQGSTFWFTLPAQGT